MIDDPAIHQIVTFLRRIGLVIRFDPVQPPTQLPGITIDQGTLVVDRAKLEHPGDLLHEAGHLAVVPSVDRSKLSGTAGSNGRLEMTAIAWSYAAALHLGIDPSVVFHADGYRGDSANLIENFEAGRYIGVPVLQWLSLTADAYPYMVKWVLD